MIMNFMIFIIFKWKINSIKCFMYIKIIQTLVLLC